MPRINFADLPDTARLWIFTADRPVVAPDVLLSAVDAHLAQWAAHGTPLTCARDWRDDHFLAIAVDTSQAGASGCSIDGLFRTISRVQSQVGADLLGSGRVAWRDGQGTVRISSRAEFDALFANGTITASTHVMNTLAESVAEWREQFEQPLNESWVKALV
jgi:hypothetical protein